MKLNKLIKRFASYTTIDILDMTGERLFPVYKVREFKANYKLEDMKKYKVLQLIAFTQEPGTITIYVEEVRYGRNRGN